MLIKSLLTQDFRKYKDLKIENIPEKGVISVSGPNESGKTSIGEAICFALFNRTFVLDESSISKLVRWGQEKAEVTLFFLDEDNHEYRLSRSVDNDGMMTVSLQKIGGDDGDDNENLVITDPKDVEEAIYAIVAFDYAAFANSFYLVQRELTAPDPNSHTIKQMAGIGDFARISDEMIVAAKESQTTLQEVQPQCDALQEKLDEINLDETWLPELIDADETLEFEKRQKMDLVDKLQQDANSYADSVKPFKAAGRFRGFFAFLSVLLIPIVLVAWVLWGLLKYSPEVISKLSSGLSAELLSSFSSWATSWLLPTAILSLVLLLLSYFLKRNAVSKMNLLNEDAKEFSKSLNDAHHHVTTEVETLLPERVVQLAQERSDKDTLLVLPPREQFTNIGQLVGSTENYQADTEELSAAVGRIEDVLKKQDSEINSHRESLLTDIENEKERSEIAGEFRVQLLRLNKVVSACKHNIKVQDTSVELLKRAALESIESFNENIARTSASTLPKFTEGRYHKLKIDEDLNVQVFSEDKEGYMDFDEISSGTQRQIMLALRMAMSEELARNTGNETQFIFLDEPFAFFDQWRTKATLNALPEVSDVITQVWIVAQEFPEDSNIDMVIECPINNDVLVV